MHQTDFNRDNSTVNFDQNPAGTSKVRFSVFNVEEYHQMKNEEEEADQFPGLELRESTGDNNNQGSTTIFAVNSDVKFLYMIGKMCCESGHNLTQGL
jgi:hypothetical protein